MNSFGVIEIASTRTTHAPGWAYVPDTGINPAVTALQPTSRKRAARNGPNLSLSDVSARQEAKVRKELEALDRDTHKDVQIPVPPNKAGGGRAQNKHTPGVRKILQSQKTFANHLDDYLALLAQAETNPAAAALVNPAFAVVTATAPASKSNSPAPSASTSSNKRSGGGGGGSKKKVSNSSRRASSATAKTERAAAPSSLPSDADVEMADAAPLQSQSQAQAKKKPEPAAADSVESGREEEEQNARTTTATTATATTTSEATTEKAISTAPPPPRTYPPDGTILPAYNRPPPVAHPGDTDTLLMSAIPPFPTDAELRVLMTAPPLSYLEARATWAVDDDGGGDGSGLQRYPPRQFCLVCGYWGRVRCLKCGGRVCALECLEVHREECLTRYGL